MIAMKRLILLLGQDIPKSKGEDDFWAECPFHDDDDASLHVFKRVDGRIEMKCFACGATGAKVCSSIGVPLEELEPEKDSLAAMTAKQHYDAHRWRDAAKRRSTPATWNDALDAASSAVISVLDAIAGDRQTASDQLVDALVDSFADRLGSMVSAQLMRELAASTPPSKTDSAVGFEGSEANG